MFLLLFWSDPTQINPIIFPDNSNGENGIKSKNNLTKNPASPRWNVKIRKLTIFVQIGVNVMNVFWGWRVGDRASNILLNNGLLNVGRRDSWFLYCPADIYSSDNQPPHIVVWPEDKEKADKNIQKTSAILMDFSLKERPFILPGTFTGLSKLSFLNEPLP